MKPFGVRLAAGAITILLGALAAAQAQKDRQKDPNSTWTVADSAVLNTPPAPITGMGDSSWGFDSSGFPESAGFADSAGSISSPDSASKFSLGSDGSIQQVQHTEPLSAESDPGPAPISAGGPQGFAAEGFGAIPALGGAPASHDAGASHEAAPSFDAPPSFGVQPSVGFSVPPTVGAQHDAGTESAPPSGFGAFDASQLPSSLTGQASGPGLESSHVAESGQPAETDHASAPTGWGMPAAPEHATPEHTASEHAASEHTAPAMQSMPAMTMGAATMAAPVMPELQFDEPPSFGAETPSTSPNTESQYAELPASPHAPEAAPTGFGGGNLLRGEASMPHDQSAGVMAPPSAFAAAPQAGSLQHAPSMNSHEPDANAYPPVSSFAADSPRIASLPSGPSHEFAPAASFSASPGAGSVQVQAELETSQTINSPGDRRLEGVQSPSVVIHKRAPSEVKVGKPAAFVIHVQNVGAAEALDVRVHDRVPAGMRLVDASPTPVMQGDSMLWQLGAMPVGDERTITMQLVPEAEGELGSVARVTFEAAASVRTISTRPQLTIMQRAPEKVLIGQQLEIELEVSNPGTGDAVGVVLQEDVPDGLEHPKGRELDNLLGTLRAGEVRHQVLRLRAVAPGRIQNVVHLSSDDGITAQHAIDVEVVAPDLHVELTGPSRRFLERQATYQLDLSNVGTADATNVEVAAYLDRGFTFVSTANEGQYDPSRHAVYWSLPQLPEGGRGQVPLTLLPIQEGERTIRLEARGDLGLSAKSERNVTVEALAELTFQISDAADPIEIGSETTYEIRLTNRGSRSDTNVQVKFQLPPGLQVVSTESDARTDDRGLVAFAPQAKLDSGQELVHRIRVRGVAPGTHLTRAIVVSDQSTVPVTKEESTMVYADQ